MLLILVHYNIKMKTIKDLLEFAINNDWRWFPMYHENIKNINVISNEIWLHIRYQYENTSFIWDSPEFTWMNIWLSDIDIIYYITSKPFIEAIAIWLWNISKDTSRKKDYENVYVFHKKVWNKWFKNTFWLINYITTEQSLAIRDNELDLFIQKILWRKKDFKKEW